MGEFRYGEHEIDLPELAIVPSELFEAAQKRLANARSTNNNHRKYDYLLVGHIHCSCGGGMSGVPMKGGRYLYYKCNRKLNQPHLTPCEEKMVNAQKADALVWEWLSELLMDEQNLIEGLQELRNTRSDEVESKRTRVATIDDLMPDNKRKIERLVKAFANEEDDIVGSAIKQEIQTVKKVYEALDAEHSLLQAQIEQKEITDGEITQIKELADTIRARLTNPSFETKRTLIHLLDVQVYVIWRNDERCLKIHCCLSPSQTQMSLENTPSTNPESVCGSSSSTTTASRRMST